MEPQPKTLCDGKIQFFCWATIYGFLLEESFDLRLTIPLLGEKMYPELALKNFKSLIY